MFLKCVRNIVSNALKFTPYGGKVTFEAWIELSSPQMADSTTASSIVHTPEPACFSLFGIGRISPNIKSDVTNQAEMVSTITRGYPFVSTLICE